MSAEPSLRDGYRVWRIVAVPGAFPLEMRCRLVPVDVPGVVP